MSRLRRTLPLVVVVSLASVGLVLYLAFNPASFVTVVIVALLTVGPVAAAIVLNLARQRRPDPLHPVSLGMKGYKAAGDWRASLLGVYKPETYAIDLPFRRRGPDVGADGDPDGTLGTVVSYYRSLAPGRLMITGDAGSGKTVLALHLFLHLPWPRTEATGPLPVFFDLSEYTSTQSLRAWMVDKVRSRLGVTKESALSLMDDPGFLPLLDGLDTMDPADSDPVRAAMVIDQLNEFVIGPQRVRAILTCRTECLRKLPQILLDATTVELEPLAARHISEYLNRHLTARDLPPWSTILNIVGQDTDPSVRAAVVDGLNRPWRLAAAVIAFHAGLNPALLIPSQGEVADSGRPAYYSRTTRHLLDGFVSGAATLYPPRAPRYTSAEVATGLGTVSRHMTWLAKRALSSTDLMLHQCWLMAGYIRVRSFHLVANLIFAAVLIALTTWIAPPSLVVDFARYAFIEPNPLSHLHFVAGILLMIVSTTAWTAVAVRSALIAWPRPSLAATRHPGILRRNQVPGGLAGGLATGLVLGLVITVVLGFGSGLVRGIAGGSSVATGALGQKDVFGNHVGYGLALGLVCGLAFGVAFGHLTGFATGLVSGLLAGIAVPVLMVEFDPAFGVGAVCGLAFGLLIAASVAVRYCLAVGLSAVGRQTPFRLVDFLAWANGARLLRVTGLSYQFRHREMQTRLSAAAGGTYLTRAGAERRERSKADVGVQSDLG